MQNRKNNELLTYLKETCKQQQQRHLQQILSDQEHNQLMADQNQVQNQASEQNINFQRQKFDLQQTMAINNKDYIQKQKKLQQNHYYAQDQHFFEKILQHIIDNNIMNGYLYISFINEEKEYPSNFMIALQHLEQDIYIKLNGTVSGYQQQQKIIQQTDRQINVKLYIKKQQQRMPLIQLKCDKYFKNQTPLKQLLIAAMAQLSDNYVTIPYNDKISLYQVMQAYEEIYYDYPEFWFILEPNRISTKLENDNVVKVKFTSMKNLYSKTEIMMKTVSQLIQKYTNITTFDFLGPIKQIAAFYHYVTKYVKYQQNQNENNAFYAVTTNLSDKLGIIRLYQLFLQAINVPSILIPICFKKTHEKSYVLGIFLNDIQQNKQSIYFAIPWMDIGLPINQWSYFLFNLDDLYKNVILQQTYINTSTLIATLLEVQSNEAWYSYYKTLETVNSNECGKILLRMISNGNNKFVLKTFRQLNTEQLLNIKYYIINQGFYIQINDIQKHELFDNVYRLEIKNIWYGIDSVNHQGYINQPSKLFNLLKGYQQNNSLIQLVPMIQYQKNKTMIEDTMEQQLAQNINQWKNFILYFQQILICRSGFEGGLSLGKLQEEALLKYKIQFQMQKIFTHKSVQIYSLSNLEACDNLRIITSPDQLSQYAQEVSIQYAIRNNITTLTQMVSNIKSYPNLSYSYKFIGEYLVFICEKKEVIQCTQQRKQTIIQKQKNDEQEKLSKLRQQLEQTVKMQSEIQVWKTIKNVFQFNQNEGLVFQIAQYAINYLSQAQQAGLLNSPLVYFSTIQQFKQYIQPNIKDVIQTKLQNIKSPEKFKNNISTYVEIEFYKANNSSFISDDYHKLHNIIRDVNLLLGLQIDNTSCIYSQKKNGIGIKIQFPLGFPKQYYKEPSYTLFEGIYRYYTRQIQSQRIKTIIQYILNQIRFQKKIQLLLSVNMLQSDEIDAVYDALYLDYPEIWYNTSLSYSYSDGIIHSVCLCSNFTESELNTMNKQFISKINQLNSYISKQQFQDKKSKLQWIYKYIGQNTKYNLLPNDSLAQKCIRSAAGPIIFQQSVCAGISYALSLLCCLADIKVFSVQGFSKNGEKHQWNIAYIDGAYLHCDVTWDIYYIQQQKELHYFCLTYRQIIQDHQIKDCAQSLGVLMPQELLLNDCIKY